MATLQSILGGGDQTEDELVTDAIAAVETSKLIESESTIESLIKSMGYQDCIVYLDGEGARVVVQSDGLDAAQAAAIKDVILGEVSRRHRKNIRIFDKKIVVRKRFFWHNRRKNLFSRQKCQRL